MVAKDYLLDFIISLSKDIHIKRVEKLKVREQSLKFE
jgi:hypothetical protein